MIRRDEKGRVVITCDTPGCCSEWRSGPRASMTISKNQARRDGWAIGVDDDACRAHHV